MKKFSIHFLIFGIFVFFAIGFFIVKLNKTYDSTLQKAIKDCKRQKDIGNCLNNFFRNYLRTKNTKTILQEINTLQNENRNIRLICHQIVHSVGHETFEKTGTISDSFTECDQTCHSGCYHGALENFLRGENSDKKNDEYERHVNEDEILSKVTTACPESQPFNTRFQCLHGLGHAIVYFLNYNLFKSLSWCDLLKVEQDRSTCRRGAFMQNVVGKEKSKRFLSSSDPHFPCSVSEDRLKNDCYSYQTSRMFEMGLSEEQIISECKKAEDWREACMQSFGRDKSTYVRVNGPTKVAKICTSLKTPSDRNACIRGVSYALVDDTWSGRYVFPFCDSLEKSEDKSYCHKISSDRLSNWVPDNKSD